MFEQGAASDDRRWSSRDDPAFGDPGRYPTAIDPYPPATAQYPPAADPHPTPTAPYPPVPAPHSPGRGGGRPRRRPGAPTPERRDPGRPPPDGPRRQLPLGVGALVGTTGLVCLVLALTVLPWFTAGGRDVTLADIRTAFTVAETDVSGLLPDAGEGLPLVPTDEIPGGERVVDEVERRARDAVADAAGTAIDSARSRYLELYADVLWMGVAGAAAVSVVLSTFLSPRSLALSLLLGLRTLSGLVTVAAGALHGAALWVVFSGDGAPEPAYGVWLGVGGLAAVLLGCIIGPRRATGARA